MRIANAWMRWVWASIGWVIYSLSIFPGDAEVASEVGGVVTLTIRGRGPEAEHAVSFLGLGLTRPAVYRGNAEFAAENVLGDSDAVWTDDQFNGGQKPYFIEVLSGPSAGFSSEIIDTDAEAHQITLKEPFPFPPNEGDNFLIRQYWTLGDLFGVANQAGLGDGDEQTADLIYVLESGTGRFKAYYFRAGDPTGQGWRSTTSNTVDETNAKIDLSRGFLVQRKRLGDVSFKVFGLARVGKALIAIHRGLNIVANVYPSGSLTLGASGLYTGSRTTGLSAGSNVSADKVLFYNGTAYDAYYYKSAGLGGTGWRATSRSSVDASDVVIPAGTSVLILRSGGLAGFHWNVPQPF